MKENMEQTVLSDRFECWDIMPIKPVWRKKNFSYLKYPRPQYGLLLLTEGRIDYHFGDEIISAKAGDLLYLPKKIFYNAVFPCLSVGYLINFEANEPLVDTEKPIVLFSACRERYRPFFEQIVRSNYGEFGDMMLIKSDFYRLLHTLIFELRYRNMPDGNDTVRRVMRLLMERPERTVAQIADDCNISESSLRRMFRAYTGKSPAQYRLQEKIRLAKQMLLSTALSPKEICFDLGFYDQAYFYKVFCKQVGMTPIRYRNSGKEET